MTANYKVVSKRDNPSYELDNGGVRMDMWHRNQLANKNTERCLSETKQSIDTTNISVEQLCNIIISLWLRLLDSLLTVEEETGSSRDIILTMIFLQCGSPVTRPGCTRGRELH